MELIWLYKNGQYTQGEIPWDTDKGLEQNGFEYSYTLGENISNFNVNVFADNSRPRKFLIDIEMNNAVNELILTDYPGMLTLLKEFTPVVEMNMKIEVRKEEEYRKEYERGRLIIE